jgi:hypothetical protein
MVWLVATVPHMVWLGATVPYMAWLGAIPQMVWLGATVPHVTEPFKHEIWGFHSGVVNSQGVLRCDTGLVAPDVLKKCSAFTFTFTFKDQSVWNQ